MEETASLVQDKTLTPSCGASHYLYYLLSHANPRFFYIRGAAEKIEEEYHHLLESIVISRRNPKCIVFRNHRCANHGHLFHFPIPRDRIEAFKI